MKKYMRWGLLLLLCVVLTTGCTQSGRLDEGNIACVVELEAIPEAFYDLDEEVRERLDIEVYLWNEVKDRSYRFHLNEENGFRQEAMLNPGFYQVRWIMEDPSFLQMDIKARQSALEVGADKANLLSVYAADQGSLAGKILWMEPSAEILSQGMFSRRIQWKGELIDLKEITDCVEFTYDQLVPAYQQASLANLNEWVGITVINETDHELPWRDCALQSVTFSSINAMLPKGVMVSRPFLAVVHKDKGCYGTPQGMAGSILFGLGLEQTQAIYLDPDSGDKITITCSGDGELISRILYEFAVFE